MNSSCPRISIVTPSYNQGEFVERTVLSVFEQRYANLEYIFMDGGSTDKTLERVNRHKNKFSHFQSGPDGGQSDAIAKGFDLSTGEIMAYLNSDDVLLPGTLNFVADFFSKNPEVDFIYGHRCIINENDAVLGHWILPKHSSFMMRRWDLIPQETCFWRRSLFEVAGNVDPDFYFAMDYDLFVRFMHSGRFKRVNRFLAAFRVHQNAKTTREMEARGVPEIKAIQRKNGIFVPPILGTIFSLYVQIRSAHWVRKSSIFPGLPPGLGFSIPELWGNDIKDGATLNKG